MSYECQTNRRSLFHTALTQSKKGDVGAMNGSALPAEPQPDSDADLRIRLARTTSERDAARAVVLSMYAEHPPKCGLRDGLSCVQHLSCQSYRLKLQEIGVGYTEAMHLLGDER